MSERRLTRRDTSSSSRIGSGTGAPHLRREHRGDVRAVLLHSDDDDSTGRVGECGDVVRCFLLLAITSSIALALEFEIPVLAHPDEVLDALDSDLIKICA